MNFCNFAKVIIGRNSKEPLSVNSSSQDGKSEIANKTSNVSSTFRYNFYSNIMYNYPKMHLPYEKFIRQLPRLQNYKSGKDTGKINVAEYVKAMRSNRMNMIQTYVGFFLFSFRLTNILNIVIRDFFFVFYLKRIFYKCSSLEAPKTLFGKTC